MASLIITVPNEIATKLLEAFALIYDYRETIEGPDGEQIPNPVTKARFARDHITSFIRGVYVAARRKRDKQAAEQAAIAAATAECAGIEVE